MFVFDSIFVSMFHVSMNYQLHTKYLYTLSQEHNFYLQVDSYVHVSQRRMIELGPTQLSLKQWDYLSDTHQHSYK